MTYFSSRGAERSGAGHHQARHHRPRPPDPGRRLTVPRREQRFGEFVPGDLRDVDVEPTRGRSVRTAQAGASGLDRGDGEVGDHDDRRHEGPAEDRRDPGRAVRHGRRSRSTRARSTERARRSTRVSSTTPVLRVPRIPLRCGADLGVFTPGSTCRVLESHRHPDRCQRPQHGVDRRRRAGRVADRDPHGDERRRQTVKYKAKVDAPDGLRRRRVARAAFTIAPGETRDVRDDDHERRHRPARRMALRRRSSWKGAGYEVTSPIAVQRRAVRRSRRGRRQRDARQRRRFDV